jgi:hypothetical protein
MLLLGAMTLLCGLIGLPPVNGVLPQAPMHTKSVATLKRQLNRAALRESEWHGFEAFSVLLRDMFCVPAFRYFCLPVSDNSLYYPQSNAGST